MIKKIPFAEYKNCHELNMSSLCEIQKSPLHFQWAKANIKDSDSLTLGRAIHTLILEPNEFEKTYAVEPKIDRRTKEGKTLAAEFEAKNAGKEILTAKEFDEAKAISDSVLSSPKIQSMLKKGQAEVSIFQKIDDVDMKFRLDFLAENFIMDVKTTRSCNERDFQRDFVNYDYHIKLAAYQHAVELETGKKLPVIVLACETTDEKDYVVYNIDQDFLDIGIKEFQKMLTTYKECVKNDEWQGLPKNVITLCAPDYLIRKSQEQV